MVKSFLLSLLLICSNAVAFSRLHILPTSRVHHKDLNTVISVPRGGSSGAFFDTSLKLSFSAIDNFYQTMPLTSAFLTCGVKASAADAVAQKTQAAKDRANEDDVSPFQLKRNFAFLMYGGLYQGVAQEVIFNEVFPILFGQGTDVFTVASKVLFDSFVVTPFVCLPVAYVVKSVIFQYSLKEAFRRYYTDVTKSGLLFKYWSIWGPVQCLTFGVVPQHLRIAFIAVVSFFWLIIFSSLTAKAQKERELVDQDEERELVDQEVGDTCSLEDGLTCKIDG